MSEKKAPNRSILNMQKQQGKLMVKLLKAINLHYNLLKSDRELFLHSRRKPDSQLTVRTYFWKNRF